MQKLIIASYALLKKTLALQDIAQSIALRAQAFHGDGSAKQLCCVPCKNYK
jgi:hypothetical protein